MIPRKCSVLLRAAKRSVPVRRSIAGQRQQYSSVGARGPLPTIEQLFSPTPEITEQEGNVLSLTMTQVLEQLREGKTTSVEITQACLNQIKRTEKLNAYISVCEERALEKAKQFDQSRKLGETGQGLSGIPIAVKDNFCVQGTKTSAGSKMLDNYISPYDSTVTKRLEDFGCIVIGKTNMDEFGMGSATTFSAYGPTINPWSIAAGKPITAGGSSGGSAAALASGSCYGAIGSDTGGSIRLPAAWTGLVGLKPTYGLSSRYGMIQYASSLDTPAIMSKNVLDAAVMLSAIAGEDPNDSTSVRPPTERSKPVRKPGDKFVVGIPKEYNVQELSDEARAIWEEGIRYLEKQNCQIVEVSLPHTAQALSAYYIIAPAEASSNLARYDGVRYGYRSPEEPATVKDMYTKNRTEAFGPEVQRRIMLGSFVLSRKAYESYYKKALQIRRLVSDDFKNVFENLRVDVLLTPTAPTTAPALDELENIDPVTLYLNDVMTIPANMAGIPAMSVPVRLCKNGLPFGLQVLANRFEEDVMLDVAGILEGLWTQNRNQTPLNG